MPINREKLETKVAAVLAKDAAAIHAAATYIPTLGTSYTAAELQAWLDKVSAFLSDWRDFTDTQIASAEQAIYNQLSNTGKKTADKIRNGLDYTLDGASINDYEKLRGIILFKFLNE